MKRKPDSTNVILGRMMQATETDSAAALAEHIGKTRQAVSQAMKKDTIPLSWVLKVSCLTGCSIDWLIFGDAGVLPSDMVAVNKDTLANIEAILKSIDNK